jgi:hypothetical protein
MAPNWEFVKTIVPEKFFGNKEIIRRTTMSIKKSLMLGTVAFLVLSFSAFSWAGDVPLTLTADRSHPGARGTAYLNEISLKIEAKGLRPDGVYTAWFVNMKPKKQEAGAGTPPYMFKTDSTGKGIYESSLSESPFGRWSVLMIVLHPTGDPKDMKHMVGALSAKIPNNK